MLPLLPVTFHPRDFAFSFSWAQGELSGSVMWDHGFAQLALTGGRSEGYAGLNGSFQEDPYLSTWLTDAWARLGLDLLTASIYAEDLASALRRQEEVVEARWVEWDLFLEHESHSGDLRWRAWWLLQDDGCEE